jgi:outer membrane protein assembly factor BamB/flagellar basal body-associated protein FliL
MMLDNNSMGLQWMNKLMITLMTMVLLFSTLNLVNSASIIKNGSSLELETYYSSNDNIKQDKEIFKNDLDTISMQSLSLVESPWPMYRQNLNHTGLSLYNTSANNGKMLWNFTTNGDVRSSPVIGPDGTIYIGSDDYKLYAINRNGTQKWNFTTGYRIRSTPAIDSNGTIYLGGGDDYFYAIYPNGTKKWECWLGDDILSSPAIISNGTIYVGCYEYLHAIYPNGTTKWSYRTGNWVWSSPAVDTNGTIYVGSWDKNLYAIYPNGTKKWSFSTPQSVRGAPAIGSDDTIYCGSAATFLYALNPDGTKKWDFWTGQVSSSPAIGPNGVIYIGSVDNKIYAIYPNGTLKWTFLTGDDVNSAPAIGSDGTIYVGSNDNKIYAIYPNGTQKWNFTTGDFVESSPAIGSDGTVYVGSFDDKLYAIGGDLILSGGIVQPLTGFTDIYFNYTVTYFQNKNNQPNYMKICIDDVNYSMIETDISDTNYIEGKDYYFETTGFDIGQHKFQFWTSDGVDTFGTEIIYHPIVKNALPNITTPNNQTAIEDTYYEVHYEYEDIDLVYVGQIGSWDYYTNATWLSFNPATLMLFGTPTNDNVGDYWVNISVNDTKDIDFTNFTLTVLNVNDNPVINIANIETTYEDELYEVDYNATDIDSTSANQVWSLTSNATSWLDINSVTGIISGIPTNDDVGIYWVNVSIEDNNNGYDFSNFTLTVLNVNHPLIITTSNIQKAEVYTLYEVDFNATDVDSPLSKQTWNLITNASNWLTIDSTSGLLSGTPTNDDVGWYNINVSVNDGDDGIDWEMFTLKVIPSEKSDNEPPKITTIDKISITVGESYSIIYEATDDFTQVDSLIWSYNSNASWIHFNKLTRTLSGEPTSNHIGWYLVNITVFDENGSSDFHNFTLTVYSNPNKVPIIITTNIINAVIGELYSVDYEANDDRTPKDNLQWSLDTNATSWLNINPNTGVLSGIPQNIDIGSYWVKISVFDGDNGWDFQNFTLFVTSKPITSFPPELRNQLMTPTNGNTITEFFFTIEYYHPKGILPEIIQIVIDGNPFNMNLNNSKYEYNTQLSEGIHTYYFTTTQGKFTVKTENFSIPHIEKIDEKKSEDEKKDNSFMILSIGVITVIIVVILIIFLFMKKKKREPEEVKREPDEPMIQQQVTPSIQQHETPVQQPEQQPPQITPTIQESEQQYHQKEQEPVQQPEQIQNQEQVQQQQIQEPIIQPQQVKSVVSESMQVKQPQPQVFEPTEIPQEENTIPLQPDISTQETIQPEPEQDNTTDSEIDELKQETQDKNLDNSSP